MNRIRRISFAASLTAIAFMAISVTTAVQGQAREDGGYVQPTQVQPFCVVEQPAKKPTEAAVAEPPKTQLPTALSPTRKSSCLKSRLCHRWWYCRS